MERLQRGTQMAEIPNHIINASYLVNGYTYSFAKEDGKLEKFNYDFFNILKILSRYFIDGKDNYGMPTGTKRRHMEYLRDTMRNTFELMEKMIKPTEDDSDVIKISPLYKMFYGIEDNDEVELMNVDEDVPYGVAKKKVKFVKNMDPFKIYLYKEDIKLLGFARTIPRKSIRKDSIKGKFILRLLD